MSPPDKNIYDFCKSGDELVKVFDALSHPLRIKIMGILFQKRQYVSELARMVNISRTLLYMHLRKLEAANLIKGNHEISDDGKAMKYYEAQKFNLHITPEMLLEFSETLTIKHVD
jgi:predicted transcriptional regulator